MASICNYSHPELQITRGLERTDQGRLFSNNPEFYDLTSSLYGPGPLVCWFLLLASFVTNWFMSQDWATLVHNIKRCEYVMLCSKLGYFRPNGYYISQDFRLGFERQGNFWCWPHLAVTLNPGGK